MSEPSVTAVKTLFAHSRNQCFFTRCEDKLTDPSWQQVNAEIAHIKGEHDRSARYDASQPDDERQGYDNLMLLCPKHHKLVDRLTPEEFSVERLVEMKATHVGHTAARPWCSDDEAHAFAVQAVEEALRRAVAEGSRRGRSMGTATVIPAVGKPVRVDLTGVRPDLVAYVHVPAVVESVDGDRVTVRMETAVEGEELFVVTPDRIRDSMSLHPGPPPG